MRAGEAQIEQYGLSERGYEPVPTLYGRRAWARGGPRGAKGEAYRIALKKKADVRAGFSGGLRKNGSRITRDKDR